MLFGIGFFCFKQMTAYELRISDWSSDVFSSDLIAVAIDDHHRHEPLAIQPTDNSHPIQLEILIAGALIRSDPTLLFPRIPVKIDLLGLQKPLRQCLSGTAPTLDFPPTNQGRHYTIPRHSTPMHHAPPPYSFVRKSVVE